MEKHVLDAIQVIEDTGKYTFSKIIHEKGEDLDAAVENLLTQV
jgi:hypothetical protein